MKIGWVVINDTTVGCETETGFAEIVRFPDKYLCLTRKFGQPTKSEDFQSLDAAKKFAENHLNG